MRRAGRASAPPSHRSLSAQAGQRQPPRSLPVARQASRIGNRLPIGLIRIMAALVFAGLGAFTLLFE